MEKQEKVYEVISRLEKVYVNVECGLQFSQPWQLLVAVRLSAQCTDERVNIVTKELFERYPSIESLAYSSPSEIENIIKSCGLGATKSRDIHLAMNMLLHTYSSVVPSTMDELLKIPGVGRKSANLILGEVFSLPSIVVDTHCKRICNRLGVVDSSNPEVIERELKKMVPEKKGTDFSHRIITFGREICTARSPRCNVCFMTDLCREYSNSRSKHQ